MLQQQQTKIQYPPEMAADMAKIEAKRPAWWIEFDHWLDTREGQRWLEEQAERNDWRNGQC